MQMKEKICLTGLLLGTNYYHSDSKRALMQWKHSSSPSRSTKKFKFTPCGGTDMRTVFWDSQGTLIAHFRKGGGNVNSASYCEVLFTFREAIRRKRPGQLVRGVLPHYDNARPHVCKYVYSRRGPQTALAPRPSLIYCASPLINPLLVPHFE
jgi:hypothetical protein